LAGEPNTCYASVGRDHVAYQVLGDGPPDLVFVPHWNTNVEAQWDLPPLARFVRSLAGFGRVIMFDKRGTGLSDARSAEDQPLLEQFADDLHAVLDAVGAKRATLIASDASALIALVFAASHPDRVDALVLVNAYAYPGLDQSVDHATERDVLRIWLDGDLSVVAPSLAADTPTTEQLVRYFRMSASPNAAYDTRRRILGLDARHALPTVQAPTLIVHRVGNRYLGIENSQYLAENIEGARLVELPGADHYMYLGDADEMLGEIELFVTGERHSDLSDRILTTVMFVDIVTSTARMAAIGDQQWRALLDRYEAEVARNLERFRGRLVKSTGDGTLVLFDGPGRAIRCALALQESLSTDGIDVRTGVHTGEVEVRGDDVTGIAVHTAQRVQAQAQPCQVLVSRTVVDLVAGSELTFDDRGEHELKGVPNPWRLYAVVT
jgi:class 3 adenylate cyclase